MADKRIDELTAAESLSDDALLVVYQEDETKSVSGAVVKAYAESAAEIKAADEVAEHFSTMSVKTGASGTSAKYDSETNTLTVPAGPAGPSGDGSGDMVKSVYDPQGKAQDIFKYVDDHSGGGQSVYVVTFNAADWDKTTNTITIPAGTHGKGWAGVSASVFALVGGEYRSGTWAALETYATVSSNGDVVLHATSGFAGRAVLTGWTEGN